MFLDWTMKVTTSVKKKFVRSLQNRILDYWQRCVISGFDYLRVTAYLVIGQPILTIRAGWGSGDIGP